jgi:hypothetical protein
MPLLADDETVVGGVRARGAVPKKLTPTNTEDVPASELDVGDLVLHESHRGPITVKDASTTTEEPFITTLHTDKNTWKLPAEHVVRRVIPEPEEAADG